MRVSYGANAPTIQIEEQEVERVREFTYLGSVVSTTGGTKEDIAAWIRKSNQAFATLR